VRIDTVEAFAYIDLHHGVVLFLATMVFIGLEEPVDVAIFSINKVRAKLFILAVPHFDALLGTFDILLVELVVEKGDTETGRRIENSLSDA
jgi:hypothetical protein